MTLQSKTIAGGLKERAALSGSKVAYCDAEKKFTWRETDQITDALAARFKEKGMAQGEHVGIWGLNSIYWVFAYFAVQKIGAVAVLINPSYLEEEVKDVIETAEVSWLLVGELKCSRNSRAIIQKIQSDISNLKKIEHLDQIMSEVINHNDKKSFNLEAKSPKDLAMIIFTSGTTSHPKGVMLNSAQVMTAMAAVAEHMRWTENDRLLLVLPLFHGSGINCSVLAAMQVGMASVLIKSYHTKDVIQAIEKYRCTVFNAVPSMLTILANKLSGDADLSSLKSGILSGSTISSKNYLKVRKKLGYTHLIPAYGMTETSSLNTMASLDESPETVCTTVGKILPGMQIRIADCESGKVLPVGKIGEIQIKGDYVSLGYYGLVEESKKSKTADGWFHTGDSGELDAEGNLIFKTRLSELIVRGGENISPHEIENAISSSDDKIEAVKVVGIPDPVMQEEVAAVIKMRKGHLDANALRDVLQSKLAYFKIPKIILELDRFPMTSSGKVDIPKIKAVVLEKTKENK